jgi:hypothetical protein
VVPVPVAVRSRTVPTDVALDMHDFWRRYHQGQDLTDQEWALLIAIVDDGLGLEDAVLPAWYVDLTVAHLEGRSR